MTFDQHVKTWIVKYAEIYKDKAEIQVQQLTKEIIKVKGHTRLCFTQRKIMTEARFGFFCGLSTSPPKN